MCAGNLQGHAVGTVTAPFGLAAAAARTLFAAARGAHQTLVLADTPIRQAEGGYWEPRSKGVHINGTLVRAQPDRIHVEFRLDTVEAVP